MDFILLVCGALIGISIFMLFLTNFGAKRGCPFCKGYSNWLSYLLKDWKNNE